MKILKMSGKSLTRRILDNDEYDIFKRLRYLDPSGVNDEFHYLAEEEGKIIGAIGVEVNPYNQKMLWVKHVVTDKEHQNQGVARKLIEEFMVDVNSRYPDIDTVELSTFTDEGRARIKKIFANNAFRLVDKALEYSPFERDNDELGM